MGVKMSRALVALLSDFGTRDHYVGAIKGVILEICPDATLVDISHDVPAHDVLTAALELSDVYHLFPSGTIFLVVVDPGVGSARRGLAIDTGDYRFVAPDNGVLTAVLQETPLKRAVELTERRYARPTVSKTFEGRDRFAPAAAWLGQNVQLSALGRPVTDYHLLNIPVSGVTDGRLSGQVLRIDHFGNVVSNIKRKTFERYVQVSNGGIQIEVGPHSIGRLVERYVDIRDDEVCAIFGSTDHLEFAANSQRAVDRLEVQRGVPVTVSYDGS
jgi:S-adenosylmethionine hydrolase